MTKKRILIAPGTTEIAREYFESLKYDKQFEVLGAGTNVPLGKSMGYEDFFHTPSIYDENFFQILSDIVSRNKIQLVIPAHDQLQHDLCEMPIDSVRTLVQPLETQKIIRSKHKTYEVFKEASFVPKIYDSISSEDNYFPIFLKPDVGQGSIGANLIETYDDLQSHILQFQEGSGLGFYQYNVVSEYLPGEELTVDCFSTLENGLVFHSPRLRTQVRNGASIETKHMDSTPEIDYIAEEISKKLQFRGAWFFQVRKTQDDVFKLLEIGGRVAGSSGLRRVQGVNLAQLSIFTHLGQSLKFPVPHLPGEFIHRRVISDSFEFDFKFDVLAVDLDDTLIINGSVNHMLVALIHKCISMEKQIWLITRHASDPIKTLSKFKVGEIFDEVIQVPESSSKGEYFKDRHVLFFDDSFRERDSCFKLPNVLSLDTSAVQGVLRGLTTSNNRSPDA